MHTLAPGSNMAQASSSDARDLTLQPPAMVGGLLDASLAWGAVGGASVGLLSLLSNIPVMIRSRDPEVGTALAAGLFATILHAMIGGIVAYVLDGAFGSFVEGLTAVALLGTLLGSDADK